mgnify:CR=1 FL=1
MSGGRKVCVEIAGGNTGESNKSGKKIYEQLVDECDVAHITKVDFEYDADAYFPNLDERPEWQITGDSEEQTYFDLEFYFLRYEKVK